MYPKFSDLIRDVFGIYIPLPFSSFGILLGLGFIVGCYFFALELWRKEQDGLLPVLQKKEQRKGILSMLSGITLGFLVGYKLLGVVFHYQEFVNNANTFIFSVKGTLIGGFLGALVWYLYKLLLSYKVTNARYPKVETIHPYQLIGKTAVMATIVCFLGARLFHYLENLDAFIINPYKAITSGGLNIYGGLIFSALYFAYVIRGRGLDIRHVGDAAAPALMLAYGIARLGCHVSGDGDWGIPNDSPMPTWLNWLPSWIWAYDYPNNALKVDLQTHFSQIGYESQLGLAWPTPVYEFVLCSLLFIILWSVRKKFKNPGTLFSIYLILNGFERILIEEIRTNPIYHVLGMEVTFAASIAIILIILGIAGIWRLNFNPAPNSKAS